MELNSDSKQKHIWKLELNLEVGARFSFALKLFSTLAEAKILNSAKSHLK